MMRKALSLLSVIFFFFSCQRAVNISKEENELLFKPMVQEEIVYISKNLEGLKSDRGKEWFKNDSIFFTNWLSGANEEFEENYKKALSYYIKALKTERHEISSYEVKLSMGRVYFLLNEKEKARKMLTEFKQEALKDLSGEEVEWGLTEEAKESLSRNIEDCDYLLGLIDAAK